MAFADPGDVARIHIIAWLAIVACAIVAYPWRAAHACSADPCWREGYFVPETDGVVPANAPGLYWRPMTNASEPPGPGLVELVELDRADEPIEFALVELESGDYVLELEADLEEGTEYRLVDESECDSGGRVGPEVEFVASAPAALPDELGELVVTPEGVGEIQVAAGAACEMTVEADRMSLALVPTADVEPWLDLLHFETLVDGEVWTASADGRETNPPGASWAGRGQDRLYALCEEYGGVSEGLEEESHEVVMRATVPGTDLSLETEPVAIELDCDGGGSAGGGGCAAGGGESKPWVALLVGLLLAAGVRRPRAGTAERL